MRKVASALLALMLLTALSAPALAAKPVVGDTLADLEIMAAPLPAEAAYLGLPAGTKSFRLSKIKAEALVVEVFSMYCPRCQAEAKNVNRVFERLRALPQGQKLKFLGIGAGNSAFEVDFFRKKYEIPVPLFHDADYMLHKAFGAVLTPTFLVLKAQPGGKGFTVLFAQEGPFADEATFLDQILSASGVK